jgi:sugar lactone lactonase YvrE
LSADPLTALGLGQPSLLDGGLITEGPLWHPGGFLTFIRLRESQLVRWDPDGTTRVIRENTGGGNGCTLDREHRLVMCHFDDRRVTRTEHDGSITVIAEQYRGRRLNQPNDIVRQSNGDLLFTDPHWSLAPEDRELGYSGVYRLKPDGELLLATDECEFPNGLAFSPDESILYVAITRRDNNCREEELCPHRYIRAFDVASDGTLSNNRIFFDMSASAEPGAPDGMKVDTDGRVYCTGPGGIWVMGPDGIHLGMIRFPVDAHAGPVIARNLAFGGDNFSTMFVTAGGSLYMVETNVRGIGAF